MSKIDIPDDELPVLKKITSIEDSRFSSLLKAINEAKPTLARTEFVKQLSKTVNGIPPEDLSEILRTVFSLYMIKDVKGIAASELTEQINKSLEDNSKVSFSSEEKSILKQRLNRLLDSNQSLAVTVKALGVMTEHEKVFCSSRIVSDIRPVFTNNSETVSAAVIIHNLQIGFHDHSTGEHREFIFALDSEDIQQLKSVIARCETKTKALETILVKSEIPYVKE